MMRILLSIQPLQARIFDMLFEQLSVHAEESLTTLILNQMKWIDVLYDSQVVVQKVFELFYVFSPSVQHDLISMLPSLVNDCSHEVCLMFEWILSVPVFAGRIGQVAGVQQRTHELHRRCSIESQSL